MTAAWLLAASDDAAAYALARDMIEVHGSEAATVARNNARAAAVAAQLAQAKSWIRVLTLIQRQEAEKTTRPLGPDALPATPV